MKPFNSGSFKNVTYNLFVYKSNIYCMYKNDLAFNNLQRLICYKTQPSIQIVFIGNFIF